MFVAQIHFATMILCLYLQHLWNDNKFWIASECKNDCL